MRFIHNSAAYIDHSTITMTEATEEPSIELVNGSKFYLQNSRITKNFFELYFLVAKSKSLVWIENCGYISNIGCHFWFSNNTDVIV